MFSKNLHEILCNNADNGLILKSQIQENYTKGTSHIHDFTGQGNLDNIYNKWDVFNQWSLDLGNSHYAFTISFPNNTQYQKLANFTIYKNILKVRPLNKSDAFFYDGHFYKNFQSFEDSFMGGDT